MEDLELNNFCHRCVCGAYHRFDFLLQTIYCRCGRELALDEDSMELAFRLELEELNKIDQNSAANTIGHNSFKAVVANSSIEWSDPLPGRKKPHGKLLTIEDEQVLCRIEGDLFSYENVHPELLNGTRQFVKLGSPVIWRRR